MRASLLERQKVLNVTAKRGHSDGNLKSRSLGHQKPLVVPGCLEKERDAEKCAMKCPEKAEIGYVKGCKKFVYIPVLLTFKFSFR